MFAGFEISLTEDLFKKSTYSIGKTIFEENKRISRKVLDDYLRSNGKLSASKIEERWFPHVEADIFLSHSHKDEKLAIKFAGWLHDTFGVKVFIDSCVWGYANELLLAIDDEFCFLREEDDGSNIYDLNKCNDASSHVYMILNGALAKMINNTECLFFLNTPNSISVKQSVEKTYSPWIYSELLLSSITEHKNIKTYRKNVLSSQLFHEKRDIEIEYNASTDHLIKLELEDLKCWSEMNQENKIPWKSMDNLYRLKGLLPDSIYL